MAESTVDVIQVHMWPGNLFSFVITPLTMSIYKQDHLHVMVFE